MENYSIVKIKKIQNPKSKSKRKFRNIRNGTEIVKMSMIGTELGTTNLNFDITTTRYIIKEQLINKQTSH